MTVEDGVLALPVYDGVTRLAQRRFQFRRPGHFAVPRDSFDARLSRNAFKQLRRRALGEVRNAEAVRARLPQVARLAELERRWARRVTPSNRQRESPFVTRTRRRLARRPGKMISDASQKRPAPPDASAKRR